MTREEPTTMKVQEIMTHDVVCCTPDTPLRDAAQMMVSRDCGAIPVVDNDQSRRVVGIITDRDITTRAVAAGRDGTSSQVRECMSQPVITVTPDKSLDDCLELMGEHQVRRVPVVDAAGACCGVVTQAQLARNSPERRTGHFVKQVSQPSPSVIHL
jgi:CBS domain-containing protein